MIKEKIVSMLFQKKNKSSIKAWPSILLVLCLFLLLIIILGALYNENTVVSTTLGFVETDRIALPSPIDGIVSDINVRAYQKVSKGQILFKINSLQENSISSVIKAPSDGYLESLNVVKDQYVTKGLSLTRIIPEVQNPALVSALLTEEQIKHISVGQAAYVRFNINPDEVYKGKIIEIARTTLNAEDTVEGSYFKIWENNHSQISKTKKYIQIYIEVPVSIDLDNTVIISGMSASVTIYP